MKMTNGKAEVDVHPSNIKNMEAKGYRSAAEVKPAPKREVKPSRRDTDEEK